jgi:hypothetical protein
MLTLKSIEYFSSNALELAAEMARCPLTRDKINCPFAQKYRILARDDGAGGHSGEA